MRKRSNGKWKEEIRKEWEKEKSVREGMKKRRNGKWKEEKGKK